MKTITKTNNLNNQQVTARFKEAALTLKRLPPVRVQGYFNSWPDIVYTQSEINKMDKKPKTYPPTPEAISKMEKTIQWLSLLETVEERKIIWMRATNTPWDEICKSFGICRSAANKRWKSVIQKITQKTTHKHS